MDKFNFQYIALIIAVVLGAVIGGSIISGIKDRQIKTLNLQHEQEINKVIKDTEKKIKDRTDSIAKLEDKHKAFELKVQEMYYNILRDSMKLQKERINVKKLTPSEKQKWILDRYSSTPK